MKIFGEVKTQSPFGWRSTLSWDELFEIANEVADVISVHTEEPWGGSLELIKKAKRLTDKPILAKGIHQKEIDVYNALAAGADLVLSVGLGMLSSDYLDRCLIEPRSIEELKRIPPGVKAVWNSRDLDTGGLKEETYSVARAIFATPRYLIQASNITKLKDIDEAADGAIIGTHLPEVAAELKQRL